jgi:hypothetical protein
LILTLTNAGAMSVWTPTSITSAPGVPTIRARPLWTVTDPAPPAAAAVVPLNIARTSSDSHRGLPPPPPQGRACRPPALIATGAADAADPMDRTRSRLCMMILAR